MGTTAVLRTKRQRQRQRGSSAGCYPERSPSASPLLTPKAFPAGRSGWLATGASGRCRSAMSASSEQRTYSAACDALTALITAHYRPTGYDAAATFGKLREWLQARQLRRWLGAVC